MRRDERTGTMDYRRDHVRTYLGQAVLVAALCASTAAVVVGMLQVAVRALGNL